MFTSILPIYPIFILLLIISSNYLAELFPCRLQNLLKNNIYFKHLFGFLTLVFFVSISIENIGGDIFELMKNSFILYLYFILLTKNNIYFFLTISVILTIIYLAHIELMLIKKKEKNTSIELAFLELYHGNKNKYGLDNLLHHSLLIILILGTIIYMGEKKLEYNKNFSYVTFFLGKNICRGKSDNVTFFNAFKNAFN